VAFPRGGREDWLGGSGARLLAARAPAFDAVVSHDSRTVLYVTGNGWSSERFGAFVSPNYFDVLGVRPYLGRFFVASEDSAPDRDAVAVIGYDFWRAQFNGDSTAVGSHIQVRARDVTVVGVAPPGFLGISVGGAPNQVWLPTMMLGVMKVTCIGRPGCGETTVLARLAAGASLDDARAQVHSLRRDLARAAFDRDTVREAAVTPVRGIESGRSDLAEFSRLLAAISALLVLIACANLAGLLVTRGVARVPEIALRFSLGAGRARVIRQLVVENLLIGLAGGAVGVVLSIACVRILIGFFTSDSEGFPHFFQLGLDARVLAFALAASLGSVLLFGVLPAFATSRLALARHASGARTLGRGRGRLVLTAAQVALSLTLLCGAALMARSYASLMHRQQFDPAHVALLRLRPQMIGYAPGRAQQLLHGVLARLARMPDVKSVAFARGIGYVWTEGSITAPVGFTATDTVARAGLHFISSGFCVALGIPLVAGREFTDQDDAHAPLVAIVTESAAHRLWPAGTALDRTIVIGGKSFRVVGVVADYTVHAINQAPATDVLIPFWQNALGQEVDARMAVRVRGDPVAALPALRRAIAEVDPAVPVTEMMSLERQVDAEYMPIHLGAVVLLDSAAVALLLTGLGLFGVVSYIVQRRTQEIGLRMAVGATPARIMGLILRQGVGATLAGVATGLLVAMLGSRLLAAYLVGVPPGDRFAFASASLAVVAVAMFASYLPARRAMRVDPMAALRIE
jgi:predicted permease